MKKCKIWKNNAYILRILRQSDILLYNKRILTNVKII